MSRDRLVLEPETGDPEVGRWLAALEEVRRDSLRVIADIPASAVDRDFGDGGDSLGTVLYHVALVEIDWIFTDVLDRDAEISGDLFPFDARVVDGRLSPVVGETLDQHLDRLARTREQILRELRAMSVEEFHRSRSRDDFDVSASWAVFHLVDHEVEHRVRMSRIRDLARR